MQRRCARWVLKATGGKDVDKLRAQAGALDSSGERCPSCGREIKIAELSLFGQTRRFRVECPCRVEELERLAEEDRRRYEQAKKRETAPGDLVDFACSDEWLDHYYKLGLTPRHSPDYGSNTAELQRRVESLARIVADLRVALRQRAQEPSRRSPSFPKKTGRGKSAWLNTT